jgi:hypothetical protein
MYTHTHVHTYMLQRNKHVVGAVRPQSVPLTGRRTVSPGREIISSRIVENGREVISPRIVENGP